MINEILSRLPQDHPWSSRIHYYDCIGSTNDRAKELALQGAPEGTVILADRQSAGRGRMGRSFQSPGGMGVYMSVILRPQCRPSDLMHLPCATAVAMCDAIRQSTGLEAGIKWTNDLVFERKKLGGILTELSLAPNGTVSHAIIGIGINCCQQPEDFSEDIRSIAASLSMVTGKAVSRSAVAAAMINALCVMSDTLLSQKDMIMKTYRRFCVTLGQDISLVRGSGVRHGKALDVDPDGGLVVEFSDGKRETVTSGEVSVRGMYGYV